MGEDVLIRMELMTHLTGDALRFPCKSGVPSAVDIWVRAAATALRISPFDFLGAAFFFVG
jgi:hypothetical protein